MHPTDAFIRKVLEDYKRIAVIGVSPTKGRPSFGVTQYLIDAGYEVVGVRPDTKVIFGKPCYERLSDVPAPLEIVDVFRAPEFIPAIVDEAIKCEAKVLWLQEGVVHSAAEQKARTNGIIVISDRCILREHLRLDIKG